MSTLWLKGIALLAMTIDHLGLVFGREGWNEIPFDSSYLRAIGRIAWRKAGTELITVNNTFSMLPGVL